MKFSPFEPASDGIAPFRVPTRATFTGDQIPAIGLGTFGSDHISGETVAHTVFEAARLGYRRFDCAAVYGNEHLIGCALEAVQRGVGRDELWVTSKLWNDQHAPAEVIPAFRKSLDNLRLDYLYLVHWPFPNHHASGVDVHSRDSGARPYIHENYMATWRELERLVERGLVRYIGTSNMTKAKLELLLRDCEIRPACNEMELHPHFQQPEFFEFVRQNDIVPIGYSPIGSPARPERDRTSEDSVDVEDPVIIAIAARLGVHPAVVCLKWAVQRGQIPIPFSTNRRNIRANLLGVVENPLTDDEMAQIAALERNCRLIKGQVFLWRENQDWRDLWDENGVIAQ